MALPLKDLLTGFRKRIFEVLIRYFHTLSKGEKNERFRRIVIFLYMETVILFHGNTPEEMRSLRLSGNGFKLKWMDLSFVNTFFSKGGMNHPGIKSISKAF
jgi:hypothetical protein